MNWLSIITSGRSLILLLAQDLTEDAVIMSSGVKRTPGVVGVPQTNLVGERSITKANVVRL